MYYITDTSTKSSPYFLVEKCSYRTVMRLANLQIFWPLIIFVFYFQAFLEFLHIFRRFRLQYILVRPFTLAMRTAGVRTDQVVESRRKFGIRYVVLGTYVLNLPIRTIRIAILEHLRPTDKYISEETAAWRLYPHRILSTRRESFSFFSYCPRKVRVLVRRAHTKAEEAR